MYPLHFEHVCTPSLRQSVQYGIRAHGHQLKLVIDQEMFSLKNNQSIYSPENTQNSGDNMSGKVRHIVDLSDALLLTMWTNHNNWAITNIQLLIDNDDSWKISKKKIKMHPRLIN